MARQRKTPKQLELTARTWGGRREGAGRKPSGRNPMPHRARQPFTRRLPVHVTIRMCEHVYALRAQRCLRPIRDAFSHGRARDGFRLVHFSVQGNHLHLIVEASDRDALRRGITGLNVRIAHRLNRVMGRKGRVISERYHAHVLRTPAEVKNAVRYVERNALRHGLKRAGADPCSSFGAADPPVCAPETWLLQQASVRRRLNL